MQPPKAYADRRLPQARVTCGLPQSDQARPLLGQMPTHRDVWCSALVTQVGHSRLW